MTAGLVYVIIKFMLTKKDLGQIQNIIDRSIKNAFQDFYDSIFEPYINKNEGEHEEMIKEIKLLRKDTDEIKNYVKDHDKRIENLENIPSVRN